MPPSEFKRKWIKLWIDECLTGTIREDVTPEERSVWYDFLLLAGRNRPPGCISANDKTPLTPKRLASILNIPVLLLAKAVKRFEDSERIAIDSTGIIHILNWDKYQYSDYDRQKPYRQKSQADKAEAFREEHAQWLRDNPDEVTGHATLPEYEQTNEDIAEDEAELFRNAHPEAVEEHEAHLHDKLHPDE